MKGSLHEEVKVVNVLNPATYAAAAEAFSTGIDCIGFGELMLVFHCGVFTATGIVGIQCEESAVLASGYVDVPGAAIANTVMIDTADETVYLIRFDLTKRLRYIRVGYDVDTANTLWGCIGILSQPLTRPVTQVKTAVSV